MSALPPPGGLALLPVLAQLVAQGLLLCIALAVVYRASRLAGVLVGVAAVSSSIALLARLFAPYLLVLLLGTSGVRSEPQRSAVILGLGVFELIAAVAPTLHCLLVALAFWQLSRRDSSAEPPGSVPAPRG